METTIKASFEYLSSSILKKPPICLCFPAFRLFSGAHINTQVTANASTNPNTVLRSLEGEYKFKSSLKQSVLRWLNDLKKNQGFTCMLIHKICYSLAAGRNSMEKNTMHLSWVQIEHKVTMKLHLNVP